MSIRLVILGGSAVSTVQIIDALADWPGITRRAGGLELVLHGRSPSRLAAVTRACRQRAESLGIPVDVQAEPDVAVAVDRADVVLNQIRVGGLEARALDESFPQQYGVAGEETMGPGGLACAIRTVRGLRPVWAAVERLARPPLIINLTNPAGIVQQAARAEFDLNIVTVCDSPVSLLDGVAQRLGMTPSQARARYVGMNHVGWYVPETSGDLSRLCGLVHELDPELPALHQAQPTAYMRYYAQPDRMLAAQRGRPVRAEELLRVQRATLDGYRLGILPTNWQRNAPWYNLAVMPLVDAWVNGSPEPLIIGLPNASRLPWLPSDVTIEGPTIVRSPGCIEAQAVAELPDLPRGLLAQHAAYERLAVQALAAGSAAAGLTRALLGNPMVSSIGQATALSAAILQRDPGPHA